MHQHIIKKRSVYDKSFLSTDTHSYRLSIKLSYDGFSFLILNPNTKRVIAWNEFEFSGVRDGRHLGYILDKLLDDNPILTQQFQKTDIIFVPLHHTLVPKVLFENTQLDTIVSLNFEVQKGEKLLSNEVRNESYSIFPMDKNLIDFFSVNFAHAPILSHHKILIDCLSHESVQSKYNKNIFLRIGKREIDILVFEQNDLLFHNSFGIQSANDIAYFVLYVYDQLKLEVTRTPLTLLGKIRKGDEQYRLLSDYIKTLKIIKRNSIYDYAYLFDSVGEGEHYEILNISICE
jgi:hypothetical protein